LILWLFATHFLRAYAGNPPSLRFGHPEGASGRCSLAATVHRCGKPHKPPGAPELNM